MKKTHKKNQNTYQKNDTITLEITDITDLGFGVGRTKDGRVVFVQDAVDGEIITAKIIKVNTSYYIAKKEEIIKKSPLWVEDRCTEGCRACAYKHISYEEECKRKFKDAIHLFENLDTPVSVGDIVPSPEAKRYRNKAQYPVAYENGEYKIGFYAPKSHRVTPVTDCPLTPRIFSEIVLTVKEFLENYKITAYNEDTGKGLVRHIYLRRGELSGEILLTLVLTDNVLPNADEFINRIARKHREVEGILINVNREFTNVILGNEYVTLYGRDYIFDTLGGVRLKITAPSFYQVNHGAAELLYKKGKELARLTNDDTLLDLYCGAGSIGLSMAREAKEVIGIEIIESAVECAKFNAEHNGIDNAYFFTGDAKNTRLLLKSAEEELGRKIAPDVIILDPPRAGCDEELINFVTELDPKRIVYISCNPKTLARDIEKFSRLRFTAGEVTLFDLFPMTGHVESVVCLTRSDKAT